MNLTGVTKTNIVPKTLYPKDQRFKVLLRLLTAFDGSGAGDNLWPKVTIADR
jgi:hypothetical protein